MARRDGELSTGEFAQRLGVSEHTARRWAQVAAGEAEESIGKGTRLRGNEVRRDLANGRYYIEDSALDRLFREQVTPSGP